LVVVAADKDRWVVQVVAVLEVSLILILSV
jgi:hypothetical protein